jgi:hypothetical protein
VLVFHGSAAGLSAAPDWATESNQDRCYYGTSVSSAGDVNGDGYADVLAGADKYDNGNYDEGRVVLFSGSPAGLASTPSWTIEGNGEQVYLGSCVATAGDVNHDGYSDVLIGLVNYFNGYGRAPVYFGSPTGVPGAPSWIAAGDQPNGWFGYSAAGAGDVNGDGLADIIVGAPAYSNGQSNEGRAVAYHGEPDAARISIQPQPESVCPGHAATFSIGAAGTLPRTYQWRRGATPLADGPTGSGSTISGVATPSLTIANAGAGDAAADYNCAVSNAGGSAVSTNTGLIVWTNCTPADLTCDGTVDFFDIEPFLLALFDAGGYAAAHPNCNILNADVNADASADFFDIDPFVQCLFGVCPP